MEYRRPTTVPPPTKAQSLQEEQLLYMDCLLPLWHKDTFIPVRLLEDYSDKFHQSAIAAAIEFSKTLQETESLLDHESSESEDDYGCVMNPTKAKIISNNFLQALPECPTIHWPSQMLNDPQLCFCPCSTYTKLWREKTKVSIHPNHGCKSRSMTPNQLMNHLKKEEDSTHKTIFIYLTKLASFKRGPARQNPAKNSCSPPVVNHDKLTGAAVDALAIASVEKIGVSTSHLFLHEFMYCMNSYFSYVRQAH
jgi:hypothetical protein